MSFCSYILQTEFVWQFGNPMMVSNADRHWLEGSVWVCSQVTARSTWMWHVDDWAWPDEGLNLRSPPIILRSMKSVQMCSLSCVWIFTLTDNGTGGIPYHPTNFGECFRTYRIVSFTMPTLRDHYWLIDSYEWNIMLRTSRDSREVEPLWM